MGPAPCLSRIASTFACELPPFIETAAVGEIILALLPTQSAQFASALRELPFETIVRGSFDALAMKLVEMEAAAVVECGGMKVPLGGFGSVVEHGTLIIGPVCEDEHAHPFRPAIFELSHIQSASILEEPSPSRRQSFLHDPPGTSSSSPW
jgi:hypothetical protein